MVPHFDADMGAAIDAIFAQGVVPSTLTLVSSQPTGTGVVYSVYRRRGALATGNVVLRDDGTYQLVAPSQ